MLKRFRWGSKRKNPDFRDLENLLQATLNPINPRPEFVRDLRRQLISQLDESIIETRHNPRQILLIASASFLSGTLVLMLGIRALIAILGALGVMHQFKQQSKEEGTNPLRPAL